MRIGGGVSASVELFAGANQAQIAAATSALDETLARYLHVVAGLYAFNGTDLIRMGGRAPGDGVTDAVNILQVLAEPHGYNGVTWDRRRNKALTTVETALVITADIAGTVVTSFDGPGVLVGLRVTAVSGTTPTLDRNFVYIIDGASVGVAMLDSGGIQVSFPLKTAISDDSVQVYPGVTQRLTGAERKYSLAMPRNYRLNAVVGGTTPSFTCTLYQTELQ